MDSDPPDSTPTCRLRPTAGVCTGPALHDDQIGGIAAVLELVERYQATRDGDVQPGQHRRAPRTA